MNINPTGSTEITRTSLAIVLPAFKNMYLRQAIDSLLPELTNQAHLYIFNDNSPHDIDSEIEPFNNHPHVSYFRFRDNLGGVDLAAHWNRCIAATQNEPWIWLFSDDDLVAPQTLTSILRFLQSADPKNVLTMDVAIVNKNGDRTTRIMKKPNRETTQEYADARFRGERFIFAADHVFSRASFSNAGGFISLPMAWYSDEISWHHIANSCGGVFQRINGCLLLFRLSGENISSQHTHSRAKLHAHNIAGCYWREQKIFKNGNIRRSYLRWCINGVITTDIFPLSLDIWQHLRNLQLSKKESLLAIMQASFNYFRQRVKSLLKTIINSIFIFSNHNNTTNK